MPQDCQLQAWESHHKYECKFLAFMPDIELSRDEKVIHVGRYRLLFRLLRMDARGKLTAAHWAELNTLRPSEQEDSQEKRDQLVGATGMAKLLRQYTTTKRSEEEIVKLLLVVSTWSSILYTSPC